PRQPRGDNPPHRTPLQPVRAAAQHSPYRAPDLRPPAPSCPTLGPASADQFFSHLPEAHKSPRRTPRPRGREPLGRRRVRLGDFIEGAGLKLAEVAVKEDLSRSDYLNERKAKDTRARRRRRMKQPPASE